MSSKGNRNSDGFGGGFVCVRSTSSNFHRVGVIFSGFKVSVFKMEFIAMEFIAGNKEEFIPIATGNRKNYINIFIKILVGSKPNKHGSVVFRRRNISRGNTKYPTPIKNPLSVFQLTGFAIVGGADVNKFTLNGSELTFKATEFKDGSDCS
jgi:hypothetical protein